MFNYVIIVKIKPIIMESPTSKVFFYLHILGSVFKMDQYAKGICDRYSLFVFSSFSSFLLFVFFFVDDIQLEYTKNLEALLWVYFARSVKMWFGYRFLQKPLRLQSNNIKLQKLWF